jgi:hypothetical protein
MGQENVIHTHTYTHTYIYVYIGVLFSHRKNETMWFEGKLMQLDDNMLNDVSQAQKDKGHMFSLICGRKTCKYKQFYEKQVTKRRSLKGKGV